MNVYHLLRPVAEIWARLQTARNWRGIRFLCYHSVVNDKRELNPVLEKFSVTTEEFRSHIKYFVEAGISIISINSATALLERGVARKGRYACFTFDDGDMNQYTIAWPILKEFGVPAHFFLVSTRIGKSFTSISGGRKWTRTFMGKEELSALVREGGTLGSHGRTHSALTRLEPDMLFSEIKRSKDEMEDMLGEDICTFAYPSALYNDVAIHAIQQAGYQFAFNISYGSVGRINAITRYAISRNLIHGNYDYGNHLTFRGGYDWAKHYSAMKTKVKGNLLRKDRRMMDGAHEA